MGVLLSFPSGDPITDFANYDANKEQQLLMRPKCQICEEHIQDDFCYYIPPGVTVCEKCMNDNFRYNTERLMDK